MLEPIKFLNVKTDADVYAQGMDAQNTKAVQNYSTVPMVSEQATEANLDDAFGIMGLNIGQTEEEETKSELPQPRSMPQKCSNPPFYITRSMLDYYNTNHPDKADVRETRAYDGATLQYDKNGRLMWINDKNWNTIYSAHYAIHSDEEIFGKLVEGTRYQTGPNSSVTIAKFDGNPVEREHVDEDAFYIMSEYDANGNAPREIKYNYKGKAEWFTDYVRDEDGKLTDKITYNGDNTVRHFCEYHYDDKNRLTEERSFDANGNMCDWEKYEYSENPVPTAVAPQKVVKLPKIAEIRQPGKANKTVQSGNMTLKYDENGYVREIYENGKLKFNIRNVETELWDMEKGTITKTGEWIRYYWYYEYNADGKKTGEYHVDEEGKAGGFKHYEYNEEGQKSRVIDYHPNGRVGVYWELEYNDEGKRIANPQCDPETGRKVTSGRALFDFD